MVMRWQMLCIHVVLSVPFGLSDGCWVVEGVDALPLVIFEVDVGALDEEDELTEMIRHTKTVSRRRQTEVRDNEDMAKRSDDGMNTSACK